jgi:hypothetical protein
MEQSTSKFNELNFNLKNIIFSFVNPLNLLKIRSNSYCRKLMDENHQSFNKYSIFYFLYNLKFNQNVLHDVDSILNFYNETTLIEIVKKRSEEMNNDCLRKQKLIKKVELKDLTNKEIKTLKEVIKKLYSVLSSFYNYKSSSNLSKISLIASL